MINLATVLKVLAPIFVIVGGLHLVLGLNADVSLGADLPPSVISDAVLDSQNRFYGVAFWLYGVIFYICAQDISKFSIILRGTFWVLFAAGLARIVSIWLYGFPPLFILILLGAELIIPPFLLIWLSKTEIK